MDPRSTDTFPVLSNATEDPYHPDTRARNWFKGVISDYSHDVRGRIMSLNLSLYLLERKSAPGNEALIRRLKEQIADLTHLVEKLQGNLDTKH